jgi:hypothetical protein
MRDITDYVVALRQAGRDAFLTEHNHPVLLLRDDDSPLAPSADNATQTHIKLDQLKARLQHEERWLVLPVVNRPGALLSTQISVGRSPSSDLCLQFSDVSSFHAYFTLRGGQVQLTDAQSKNGTTVNGLRLQSRLPVAVPDGALIAFSLHQAIFYTAQSFVDHISRLAASKLSEPIRKGQTE